MTADEQLNLLGIKVERAKEHVRVLEVEIQAFLSTRPYAVATKRNPQSRRLIYNVASVRETPIRIAAIAGDVIHNLRSALDHLAYQLVLIGTGATPTNHIYFPIADDAAGYTKSAFGEPGIIEGEPLVETLKQMVDVVDQLMPTFKLYLS